MYVELKQNHTTWNSTCAKKRKSVIFICSYFPINDLPQDRIQFVDNWSERSKKIPISDASNQARIYELRRPHIVLLSCDTELIQKVFGV